MANVKGCNREIRTIRKAAQQQGWTERTTGSGHFLLKSPTGATVTLAATPRRIETSLGAMRRAGLVLATV